MITLVLPRLPPVLCVQQYDSILLGRGHDWPFFVFCHGRYISVFFYCCVHSDPDNGRTFVG